MKKDREKWEKRQTRSYSAIGGAELHSLARW